MALLATLPFTGSLAGGFVYDDHVLIEQRSAVHSLAHLSELWRGEFWQGLGILHFRYLRPVVSTSYALDWTVWNGNPLGFHLTNLVLHAVVAFLLYGALLRWTGALAGAFLATLAWAWHPSKVEAVSWIAGRTDLLCAFGILVMCAGVKKRLSGSVPGGVALEILGLGVALLSKEHAVVAPAFVAVEAWAHAPSCPLERAGLLRIVRPALPHGTAVVAYMVLRWIYLPIVPERVGSLSFVDARLYTVETLGEFARVVFYPFALSIQRAPIRLDAESRVIHDPARLAVGLAFIGLAALAVAMWKRRRSAAQIAGLLLGAAALVPVANVLSARMIFLFAERFAYVPLMGFAMCIVAGERFRPWQYAPWAVVLMACGTMSALHTRDFLDDRHLWEHELAQNPKQPLALRFACEDAMRQHKNREALALAVRGYRATEGWPGPQPDRVEFAARAARSLELVTLDADRSTLAQTVAFYETLLAGRGTAYVIADGVRLSIDAGGNDARNFREGDVARVATTKLWAATAATRVDRCDVALPMVRDYLSTPGDPAGNVAAALVLGRCSRWDEALAVTRLLDASQPAISELARNLAWIQTMAEKSRDDLDSALGWSRARTMLLDRGGAYQALVPWRDAILTDAQGALFFARAAWAAGEDDVARQALEPRVGEQKTSQLLASWSRELGREQ